MWRAREERVRGEGNECVWETRQSTARCRREGMCVFESRKQREEERVRGECRQGMCVGEGRRARDVCVGKQGMCVCWAPTKEERVRGEGNKGCVWE